MASNTPPQPGTSSGVGAQPQEFRVRVPQDVKKKYSIFQFNASNNVDFTKSGSTKVERENNLREFKLSHNIDLMPKYGAGSEFGREQKEEARRKKYGIMKKRYNPEAQPWLMKMGAGKQTRKFKGTKNGGVMENSSFYIFTQCADGAFDAFPVDDWYNFTPVIKYKYLNSEEVEEEFNKRDRTLNYFSLMLKKRLKTDEVDDDDDGDGKKKKTKSKSKGLMLTEMDDWADFSDENSGEGSEDEDKVKRRKKQKIIEDDDLKKKRKKSRKANSDDEAVEESDSMDEGQEIDYMSDSGESNDEDMYNKEDRDENKYGEKGVEDEDGLRKLVDSEDEDEEEEEDEKKKKKATDENEEEDEKDGKKKKKENDDSDSESSSSSGSESDLDKEDIKSALFMMKKGGKKKLLARRGSASSDGSAPNSRSTTPTVPGEKADKALKKRSESPSQTAKKIKLDPAASSPVYGGSSSDGGITEEAVRRYLMRKPMTTTDLVHKFKTKNTGLTKEQQVKTIAQILKRLNPERLQRKDKLYLFIKKVF